MAPVLLFVYKRLDCLHRTLEALKCNQLASCTDLYIFSDAARNGSDEAKVEAVRKYLQTVSGFRTVVVENADKNMGLARSIRYGVTKVLKSCDQVIVLEDDLVTSPNFLLFMNQSLRTYKLYSNVFSVSGYTFPVVTPTGYNSHNYFHRRGCSWGWATWRDRWDAVNWNLLENVSARSISDSRFLGSDFPSLIRRYQLNKIDSWAVPWCYHQFREKLLTVYPMISKVQNIGFTEDATHTFVSSRRYNTQLDASASALFNLNKKVQEHCDISSRVTQKFSYYERLKWKILDDFQKVFS